MAFHGLSFLNFTKVNNPVIDISKLKSILQNKDLENFLIDGIIKEIEELKIQNNNSILKIIHQHIINYIKSTIHFFEIDNNITPHIITLCGVNGSGKTATSFKMCNLLLNLGYKAKLVSCDIIRPGAKYQFEDLQQKTNIESYYKDPDEDIFDFINKQFNKKHGNYDVVILDSPGIVMGNKVTIDYVSLIINLIKDTLPQNKFSTLFVADANMGADILSQILFIKNSIDLDGMFISKMETTSRIGQILRASKKFDIPIYGIGNGINMENIEEVSEEKIAHHIFKEDDLL